MISSLRLWLQCALLTRVFSLQFYRRCCALLARRRLGFRRAFDHLLEESRERYHFNGFRPNKRHNRNQHGWFQCLEGRQQWPTLRWNSGRHRYRLYCRICDNCRSSAVVEEIEEGTSHKEAGCRARDGGWSMAKAGARSTGTAAAGAGYGGSGARSARKCSYRAASGTSCTYKTFRDAGLRSPECSDRPTSLKAFAPAAYAPQGNQHLLPPPSECASHHHCYLPKRACPPGNALDPAYTLRR